MSQERDLICLRGIRASAVIGVRNWERQVRQTVLFDLELAADISRGARSDDIADTVDYERVSKELIRFAEGSNFRLLESLVEESAALVLQRFPVSWLRLRACKLWALSQVREVSIVIVRSSADK